MFQATEDLTTEGRRPENRTWICLIFASGISPIDARLRNARDLISTIGSIDRGSLAGESAALIIDGTIRGIAVLESARAHIGDDR